MPPLSRSVQEEQTHFAETSGQYGPDGAYYPGHYGPDGRFIATCRISPDGQRHPIVMGPDGRFYANAYYTSDGRFHLGEAEADKHGVVFLSAQEMAVLRANQPPRQGVVGPDGLFYPHGFYQSDGTFVNGGPPHPGHPQVWGPTLGRSGQTDACTFPPTEFGPAWPPNAPPPYSNDGQQTFQSSIKNDRFPLEKEQIPVELDASPDLTGPPILTDSSTNDAGKSLQTEQSESPHPPHAKDTDGMRGLYSETSSLDPDDQSRDLFSPWGKDEDLPNLPIAASVTFNEEGSTARAEGVESCDLDDLNKDVPLSKLDSRIVIGSDDESLQNAGGNSSALGETSKSGGGHDGVGNGVSADLPGDRGKSDTNEMEHSIRSKKRRDSTATYMGITDRTDSTHSRRDSSHSHISKARRGSMVSDARRGSKAIPAKPGKNPAVKNVTGKPETKPGMLQKHMFATPSATLAQTNILGINKRSGLDNAPAASKEDIQARKPKLPAIGGGEPLPDGVSRKSPSPTKQIRQSISRIGSGEKRKSSNVDSVAVPPDETVKSRPGKEKLPKVKKKRAKDVRKIVGKRQESTKESRPETLANKDEIDEVNDDGPVQKESQPLVLKSPVKQPIHDTIIGTYQDLVQEADAKIKELNCEERSSAAKLTDSSSLLDKFSEFRVSVPASSPSPLPTEHAPSFRMTYSTLPSFGVKEAKSTAPTEDVPMKTKKKPSKSKSIPFDFEKVEKGYEVRARTSSTRSLLSKKGSAQCRPKKSKKSRRRSGSVSSEASSRPSSAESVWESISEIWKRHKEEIANLEKCVTDSYLPLTHAFTFSVFPLAPGYAARNKMIFERAAAIKQLRQPIQFNKSRRAAKLLKKRPNTFEKSLLQQTAVQAKNADAVTPVK